MEWIVEAETLSDFIDHGRYTLSTKPLIRCKDCKCWDTSGYCIDFMTQDDGGFCAWAERKTDE